MPIVCGIHPVLEALAIGSRTIERVVVTKGVRNKRILEVIRKASERGVPLRFEPREALDRTADGERHQGVLAIVAEKGLLTLEELQKSARTPALFMLLDGVEDPRNLGAIIRSVDASGADGVILPDRHTASLSDAASRTAAGALESVKIARIGNVVQALESLKAKGFWIVGFDGSGKERWDAIDYKRPVVLVLGGEGKGIRRLVKEHCDHVVSLPVFGQVSSLNVSVAAGIALYEAVRQRGTVPTLARPIPPRALVAKKPVVIGPSPEDREEDPGARRRAAAIASLSSTPESARSVKPPVIEAPPPSTSDPAGPPHLTAVDPDESENVVPEASLEAIVPEENGAPEGETRTSARPSAEADIDDEGDETDEEDDGENDDDGAEDDGDGDDEGGEVDDDDYEDGDDDDDDDEDDDEGDDPDEDKGDAASDLAAPFMPDDNSGGGEVTWGSEKELHAHRPRREGERRFTHNGARRSGRPNDRKKAPKVQGGGTAPAQGGRPSGQAPPPGGQGRDQGRDQNRDQNRGQNRQQQRRGPDRNRQPRPPQEGGATGPQEGRENPRPADQAPQGGNGERPPEQGRDQSRPQDGPRRNRRRRGGRGRSGGAPRPGDQNQKQNQNQNQNRPPRDGGQPRGQESQSPQQNPPPAGNGDQRPAGDGAPRESGGGAENSRRDQEHRRRRRRGRRGNGGPGGRGNGGPAGSGGSNPSGGSGGSGGGDAGPSGSSGPAGGDSNP